MKKFKKFCSIVLAMLMCIQSVNVIHVLAEDSVVIETESESEDIPLEEEETVLEEDAITEEEETVLEEDAIVEETVLGEEPVLEEATLSLATTEVEVTDIILDQTSVRLNAHAEVTLIATIEPQFTTNQSITWSSSDTNIATVDAKGKVTAVGPGNATITASTKDGEKTATCEITVVLENTYDSETGTVILNKFDGKNLGNTIKTVCSNPMEELKTLIVTSGNISTKDAQALGKSSNYKNLEVLELKGSANINNGTLANKTFENVDNLKTVILPNVTTLNKMVFYTYGGTNTITRIELPKLESFDNRAFYGCSNLSVLVLGDTVPVPAEGSGYWFKYVTNLIVFVPTEEAIAQYKNNSVWKGFEYCIAGDKGIAIIEKDFSIDGLQELVDEQVVKLDSSYDEIKRLTIINGVVGDEDFNFVKRSLPNLEIIEVRLRASVDGNKIKPNTFEEMTSLKKVVFADITEIQEKAFKGCTYLKIVDAKYVTKIEDSAFEDCSSLEAAKFTRVTEVGDYAFKGASSIKLIDMPSVKKLGNGAFKDATSLTEVKVRQLEVIGDYSFSGCSSLQEIVLHSVTTIGKYAFANNSNLTYIRLPELIYVDSQAFQNSSKLNSLCLGKVVPNLLAKDALVGLSTTLTTLYVNPYSVELFLQASPWNNYIVKADPEIYTGKYYKGDYKTSLNLYGFNVNINKYNSGTTEGTKPVPLSLEEVLHWAAEVGFDAVDITAYYLKGWDGKAVIKDGVTKEEAIAYGKEIGKLCKELGLEISGTGTANNFASIDEDAIATDIERAKLWIDVAEAMGAPCVRVFAGDAPADYDELGWEYIVENRIIPAIKELADYAAPKGVTIGVQNHGDMLYNAERTIQFMEMLNYPHKYPNGYPNVGIINDTGYYRSYAGEIVNDSSYDWYADIEAVLPYSVNFQAKRKPGGAGTEDWLDIDRMFQDIRRSSYRGYIPMELVWSPNEPNNPSNMDVPAFEEIEYFLRQVEKSLEDTKYMAGDYIVETMEIEPVTVPEKTSFANLSLPETVKVKIDDREQSIIDISVVWNSEKYRDTAGKYIITGKYTLPIGVLNPDGFIPEIKIIVSKSTDDKDNSSGGSSDGSNGSGSGGSSSTKPRPETKPETPATEVPKTENKVPAVTAIIKELTPGEIQVVKKVAAEKEIEIIGTPIRVEYEKKQNQKFNMVEIPLEEGMHIATMAQINKNGNLAPVPTMVVEINGKRYIRAILSEDATLVSIDRNKSFVDIENHWAKNTINSAVSKLLVNGIGEKEFAPNKENSRAETAQMLLNVLGVTSNQKQLLFKDVTSGAWYANAVSQISELGIMNGDGTGNFMPNKTITRQEVAAAAIKTLQLLEINVVLENGEADTLLKDYKDANLLAPWAKEAMAKCIKLGIFAGNADGTLSPTSNLTRAQGVVIISKLQELFFK